MFTSPWSNATPQHFWMVESLRRWCHNGFRVSVPSLSLLFARSASSRCRHHGSMGFSKRKKSGSRGKRTFPLFFEKAKERKLCSGENETISSSSSVTKGTLADSKKMKIENKTGNSQSCDTCTWDTLNCFGLSGDVLAVPCLLRESSELRLQRMFWSIVSGGSVGGSWRVSSSWAII